MTEQWEPEADDTAGHVNIEAMLTPDDTTGHVNIEAMLAADDTWTDVSFGSVAVLPERPATEGDSDDEPAGS